jgi:hypothetical protein
VPTGAQWLLSSLVCCWLDGLVHIGAWRTSFSHYGKPLLITAARRYNPWLRPATTIVSIALSRVGSCLLSSSPVSVQRRNGGRTAARWLLDKRAVPLVDWAGRTAASLFDFRFATESTTDSNKRRARGSSSCPVAVVTNSRADVASARASARKLRVQFARPSGPAGQRIKDR